MVRGKSIHRVGHLTAYADTYSDWVAGELVLLGLGPLARMLAHVAVDVVYALAVRQAGPGALATLHRRLAEPYWLTDESWGTGPTAEAGQDAMMAMLGTGKVPDGVAKRK